jgi:hypothetical protein
MKSKTEAKYEPGGGDGRIDLRQQAAESRLFEPNKISIALGCPKALRPLEAMSFGPQALRLLVERVDFFIKLGGPAGFRCGVAAQLLEGLADGKFGCLSHDIQSRLLSLRQSNHNECRDI